MSKVELKQHRMADYDDNKHSHDALTTLKKKHEKKAPGKNHVSVTPLLHNATIVHEPLSAVSNTLSRATVLFKRDNHSG
jgi:hypothetical protein